MQTSTIPIVFTPDENYIVQTSVAILSILRTKKTRVKYKFYIIVSNKFDNRYFKYLERLKKLEKDFVYEVKYINSEEFDNQKINIQHTSPSTYYRLILADVLPEYDKCMYHDSDILVNEDIKEMFDINLDDFYLAGVRVIEKQQETEFNLKLMKKLGFVSFDNYIYVGDLTVNLAKIRENKLIDEFKREMVKGYPSADQDVINYCCYGKIYFLPLKFCMLNSWISNNILMGMKKQLYQYSEIEEAKRLPSIIHFLGGNTKPWCNLRTIFGDLWWTYAKEILSEKEYNYWYEKAKVNTLKRDWGYLKNVLEPYKAIIIFGFSKIGKSLFDVLKRWGHDIECFVDNDASKWGQKYEECEVLNIENALGQFSDAIIVNSSQRFSGEIKEQLHNMGVDDERIIDYIVKDERYYLSIDPQYYAYEYRDICVREFGWMPDE